MLDLDHRPRLIQLTKFASGPDLIPSTLKKTNFHPEDAQENFDLPIVQCS